MKERGLFLYNKINMSNNNELNKIEWKAEIDPIFLKIIRKYEEDYKGFHFDVTMTNVLYNRECSATINMKAISNLNDNGKEIFKYFINADSAFKETFINDTEEKIINELKKVKDNLDVCFKGVEVEGYNKTSNELQRFVENEEKKPQVRIPRKKTTSAVAV